jgi:hypothetical protein
VAEATGDAMTNWIMNILEKAVQRQVLSKDEIIALLGAGEEATGSIFEAVRVLRSRYFQNEAFL